MAETKEEVMRVSEISKVIGADPGAIYTFMSRNAIPRYRRQKERGVFVDARAYIAVLRERGYIRDAEALERFLQGDHNGNNHDPLAKTG